MIRYVFGENATESQKKKIRESFETISKLVPIPEDFPVVVQFPVELPIHRDELTDEVIGYTQARTNFPEDNSFSSAVIEISPMDFEYLPIFAGNTFEYQEKDNVAFTIAHEWGHIVSAINWEQYTKQMRKVPPRIQLMMFLSESDYGQSDPIEGIADSFAEWHLSRGQSQNYATKMFAKMFAWRTSFA